MANRLEPGQFSILIFLTDFKLKQSIMGPLLLLAGCPLMSKLHLQKELFKKYIYTQYMYTLMCIKYVVYYINGVL